jgi:aspartyl-tRNA(Asn)/glutamyl-tRNA(Gln) amidotransferase subunit C
MVIFRLVSGTLVPVPRRSAINEVFMSIDVDEVKKIARLACLDIKDQDIESYANNLSSILDLVAQMNAIDTSGVTPMSHPFDAVQRLREDVVTDHNRRDDFMAIAPKSENGLYLVPKVIE